MERHMSMQRIIYFDVLRIVTVFAVVVLHVCSRRFIVAFPSTEWEVLNVYDSLTRWGVPVFVMISGALFLDEKKDFSIKRLYRKNVVHIICAFVCWSFVSQLTKIDSHTTVDSFVQGCIEGPFHLWFLKMLLGLYVVVPILRRVVQDRKTELYFLMIALLTAFLLPLIPQVLLFYDPALSLRAEELIDSLFLNIATGYTGYFVLGHFLHHTIVKRNMRRMVYVLGFVSAIGVMVLTSKGSHNLGEPTEMFYHYLTPFTLFEAAAVFLFFSERFWNRDVKRVEWVVNLSKLTFGIYLVHPIFIKLPDVLWGINSSVAAPWFIPVFSCGVFVVSLCVTWIISKIPVANKYVI